MILWYRQAQGFKFWLLRETIEKEGRKYKQRIKDPNTDTPHKALDIEPLTPP